MSLLDRLEVPEAKSRASTSPTDRPRVAASRAAPLPTTPPPTTRTSSSVELMASRASSRACGESATDLMVVVPFLVASLEESVDVYPVQRPGDGLLPALVPGRALLVTPLRLPALRLVPVRSQLVGGLPEPDGEPRRVRSAQCRGLRDDGPAHRHAEH